MNNKIKLLGVIALVCILTFPFAVLGKIKDFCEQSMFRMVYTFEGNTGAERVRLISANQPLLNRLFMDARRKSKAAVKAILGPPSNDERSRIWIWSDSAIKAAAIEKSIASGREENQNNKSYFICVVTSAQFGQYGIAVFDNVDSLTTVDPDQ